MGSFSLYGSDMLHSKNSITSLKNWAFYIVISDGRFAREENIRLSVKFHSIFPITTQKSPSIFVS